MEGDPLHIEHSPGHDGCWMPTCRACTQPFTDQEWDTRHSDPYGEDVHERCCVQCTT